MRIIALFFLTLALSGCGNPLSEIDTEKVMRQGKDFARSYSDSLFRISMQLERIADALTDE